MIRSYFIRNNPCCLLLLKHKLLAAIYSLTSVLKSLENSPISTKILLG